MDNPVRFPYILSGAAVVAFIMLCALGSWQLQRADYKKRSIESLAVRSSQPPITSIGEAIALGENAQYRNITLSGYYLPAQNLVQNQPAFNVHGIFDQKPVWRSIWLFQSDKTVLVDRGFYPFEFETNRENPRILPAWESLNVSQTLSGQIRFYSPPGMFTPPPSVEKNQWYSINPSDMMMDSDGVGRDKDAEDWVSLSGYAIDTPFYILLHKTDYGAQIGLDYAAPFSSNQVRIPPSQHIGYALTWFGLAIGLIGIYIAYIRKYYGQHQSARR